MPVEEPYSSVVGIEGAFMARCNRSAPARVRTLFLSDTHLGFKRSRARDLADFLATIDADSIVLVGDIVDSLSLAQRFFWPAQHARVVHALLAKQCAGTRLVYIPGNHDEDRAPFAAMMHGKIEVHREWLHHTARGERLLVLHGDQFDGQCEVAGWLHWLGETVYDLSVVLNGYLNDVRVMTRLAYWPLAERLKLAVATSARFIERFEEAAIAHARAHGYDGIICGHIHRANLRRVGDLIYCNTGDWVESCSALIEETNGELRLWRLEDAGKVYARCTSSLLAGAA
jgi:UDP-2,3-diacylglucosamine pyrophosphatase LpxH